MTHCDRTLTEECIGEHCLGRVGSPCEYDMSTHPDKPLIDPVTVPFRKLGSDEQ